MKPNLIKQAKMLVKLTPDAHDVTVHIDIVRALVAEVVRLEAKLKKLGGK